MATRKGMEVSIGVAEAAALCDPDVIAAYPITPQTHIVEHLSEIVADGHLDAEFVPVESEHSAMSCCCGSSQAGARTFTATASQGLELMHEILFIASGMRLPIVMAVANRALSAPISIWNDHGDVMAARDVGWIQIFAENGQESFDLIPLSFRVAEDPRVLLPMAVNFDGFILSHVVEPIEVWDKAEVEKYLPPHEPRWRLDVENPMTFGPVGIPDIYAETRMAHNEALRASRAVIDQAFDELHDLMGRRYHAVEHYKTDDADIVFFTMGGITETCMTAVNALREKGKKAGIVHLRLFRPFPEEDLRKALLGRKAVVAIDRALSTGFGGPMASEIKSALYGQKQAPPVVEFIAGLGGRDVKVSDFIDMYERGEAVAGGADNPGYSILGVRE